MIGDAGLAKGLQGSLEILFTDLEGMVALAERVLDDFGAAGHSIGLGEQGQVRLVKSEEDLVSKSPLDLHS